MKAMYSTTVGRIHRFHDEGGVFKPIVVTRYAVALRERQSNRDLLTCPPHFCYRVFLGLMQIRWV